MADLRERLQAAAGEPADGPDVIAAMVRGERLRRRRRTTRVGSALAVVALSAAIGAAMLDLGSDPSVPPIGEGPERGDPGLGVLEQPLTSENELTSWSLGGTGSPGLDLELPPARLAPPAHDEQRGGSPDLDPSQARRATKIDGLEVYVIPALGSPVGVDGEELDGEWVYVYATAPGWRFWGSAPVPAPDGAAWAGSFPYGVGDDHRRVGIVVVGDGLDTATAAAGTVPVENNIAVIDDFGHDSVAEFEGPAGDHTLTTSAPEGDEEASAPGRRS